MGQTDFDYGFNDIPEPDYKTDDPPSYAQACMGMLICPHCGKAKMCSEIPTEESMTIPRNQDAPSGQQQNGRGKRKATGLRYLTVDMLTSAHQLCPIIDARVQPDTYRPNQPDVVVVKIKFKGEFILWTLRHNNPCLEALGDALGEDEQQWKGREVELFCEEDSFDGKKWIRVDVVPAEKATKGKK